MRPGLLRRWAPVVAATLAAGLALAATGCGGDDATTTVTEVSTVTEVIAQPDECASLARFGEESFAVVTAPLPGAEVESGFDLAGCSRTFESNVPWTLRDADGEELTSGSTMGGGVDGPDRFATTVDYTVAERQMGSLEVTEDDPSGGAGQPPVQNVIPVVLTP